MKIGKLAALAGGGVPAGRKRSQSVGGVMHELWVRTKHEAGNAQAVLDGELDPFITEHLRASTREGAEWS